MEQERVAAEVGGADAMPGAPLLETVFSLPWTQIRTLLPEARHPCLPGHPPLLLLLK